MKPMGSNRPLILAQAGVKRDVTTIFKAGLAQMKMALVRSAGADGQIRDERQARLDIRQITSDLFTDRNEHAFAADGVTAVAPYPRVLNQWLAWAVYQAVKQQESWLKRNVPEDVFHYLQSGRRRWLVSEQINIFEPNPLAEIDPARQWVPPHKWTDERGYRLSDRIWRTDMETRRKIDELLAKGLQEGKSALEIANALEAYLLPGREGIRTLTPYGRRFMPGGASYDAMRLARTEIARAFNEAAFVSGYVNPYTEGVEYARSANGDPSCPICPLHATIGIGGERIRPAYPKQGADIPPAHPHCMCYVFWTMTDKPETITAELRSQMLDSQAELGINPADAEAFTRELLGSLVDGNEAWFNKPMGGESAFQGNNIQFTLPKIPPGKILTPDGYLVRDTGSVGDTLESLNQFIQNSNGPLARAFRQLSSADAGFPPLQEDWGTGGLIIDKQNLKDWAKAFVAEARNTEFDTSYIVSALRSTMADQGITITEQQAQTLYASEYRYQAQAALDLARISNTRFTEAQMRWLTDSAGGNYWELTSASERASARKAFLNISGGGSQNMTDAARREFRVNFLRMINGLD